MAQISACTKCRQAVMWKAEGWWNHATGYVCPSGGEHVARARR